MERDPEWAAPLLWRSEFRSVLAAFMRQPDLSVAEAWRAHGLAERLLAGQEFTVPGDRVLALVAASACSAYDAVAPRARGNLGDANLRAAGR